MPGTDFGKRRIEIEQVSLGGPLPRRAWVVRDDRIPGGTKTRILSRLFEKNRGTAGVTEKPLLYAAHPYGYGAEALAVAAMPFRRPVFLLFPEYADHEPDADARSEFLRLPRPMRRAVTKDGVTYVVIRGCTSQTALQNLAARVADLEGYQNIPVGFAWDEFQDELVGFLETDLKAHLASIEISPSEVWVTAGSGLLARSLAAVFGGEKVKTVDLGMQHCKLDGIDASGRFEANEGIEQPADQMPPFPSARFYDAKMWAHVLEHAAEDALIWNVAG